MNTILRFSICTLLCLSSPPAHADDEAKELYRQATAHFSLGRFTEAAKEYEAAFERVPDPVILYNIAQSYRLGGDNEKALFFYKSFLQRNPKAQNRLEVEDRITTLTRVVAEQKRSQERPPNSVQPPESEPPKETPKETPKENRESKPMTEEAKAPAAPQRESTPVYKRWWLWTLVGVAAAGVAVGLGVGLTQPNHFSTNLPEGGPGAALTVGF